MPFGNFLPREDSFFDFFEQHAKKCVEGAYLLQALFKNPTDESLPKQIKEVEHECDRITHHAVETLHKTFITPIDRQEIHALISGLDDVADFIDATAQRIAMYDIRETKPEATELCEVITKATEQVERGVRELRRLKRPMDILKTCVEINRLENEGDAVLRRGMARLFRETSNAIEVIKWKEIYEFLEEAPDRCEDVANIIEGVVLEHG